MKTAANSNIPAHGQQRLAREKVDLPYVLGDYVFIARLNDYIGLSEPERDYLTIVESIKLDTTREFMRRLQMTKLNEAYNMLGHVQQSREGFIDRLRESSQKHFMLKENDSFRKVNEAIIRECLKTLKSLCGD